MTHSVVKLFFEPKVTLRNFTAFGAAAEAEAIDNLAWYAEVNDLLSIAVSDINQSKMSRGGGRR